MKVCSRCKVEKNLSDFQKNRTMKDGYAYSCKECSALYYIKYKEGKKDKLYEYYKKYREENRDRKREIAKKYYHKNKDKINENKKNKGKNYWNSYIERIRKDPEKYDRYLKNKKIYNKMAREKIKNDDFLYEKNLERHRKYYHENINHCRSKTRRYSRERSKNLTDTYVKSLICKGNSLSPNDIPVELIQLKREQMKLKRCLKEVNNVRT